MSISDKNSSEYRSNITAQNQLYSDLNLFFPIHPNKKDIIPVTDVDAIKQSVRNLVLTNYGEKLFNPKFGGNVTSYLFENVNRYTQLSIYTEINSILAKFEKRITDVDVRVDDDIDDNSYNIAISFRIKTSDELAEIGFALKRLR